MNLFETAGFMPRWSCGDWGEGLGWLSIAAHVLLAAVYVLIPLLLVRAARSRTDLPYRGEACLFAAFIFCCGVGHAINVLIFWQPVYRFLVMWDVTTALVSSYAFCRLVPVIPVIVSMRSPAELQAECDRREKAETALEHKVLDLEDTEKKLRHANRDLENALALKQELERRIRELETHHTADENGTTPTQAAIARMNEATKVVALAFPAPSANGTAACTK